ncbi:MAG: hypothetical protein AAF560_29450 [Acidobacteriota bacterium]
MFVSASSAAAQTPPYGRTVIVPATGNASINGAALISALASLSPSPGSGTRWLIKLDAGVYDVGTTPVVMREQVDIEGSGVLMTTIRGSVAPALGSLVGGLVEGASQAELRSLTVACNSDATTTGCQGISIVDAHPRLTDLRILVQGTGTSGHWGIRTFNSRPVLDRVEIQVSTSTSGESYGIVYGGSSKMDIARSSILVRNASGNNWGVVFKESLEASEMRDSSVIGIGGTSAAGIMHLQSFTDQTIVFDNVQVTSHGGTVSTGIGADSGDGGKIFFRGGRISGATHGVNLFATNFFLSNSEVSGTSILVFANKVRLGSSWLRGGGSISALTSAVCAGVHNDAFTFFPNTCP